MFRRDFIDVGNVDVCLESCTVASACNKLFRKRFLKPETIGLIIPSCNRNYSKKAFCGFSIWKRKTTVRNCTLGTGAKLDCQNCHCAETRTVYEFMGCFFHGCVKCQPSRDLKTLGEDTLAERYERKMARLELITNAGYTVKVMWECEFQESRITEMKPHLLTHPLLTHSPQHTRDALYGGRTEAMSLHYKVEENRETIQYCDVIVPVYLSASIQNSPLDTLSIT